MHVEAQNLTHGFKSERDEPEINQVGNRFVIWMGVLCYESTATKMTIYMYIHPPATNNIILSDLYSATKEDYTLYSVCTCTCVAHITIH